MTITSRVHGELFAPAPPTITTTTTITSPRRTYASNYHTSNNHTPSMNRPVKFIRMPLHNPRVDTNPKAVIKNQRRRERRQRGRNPNKQQLQPKGAGWTADEHERFLRGLELFPHGPWKEVANFVGTRSVRQTMTHAQKYRQKIARHQRRLHLGCSVVPRAAKSSTVSSSCCDGVNMNMAAATNAATTENVVPNDEWFIADGIGTDAQSHPSISLPELCAHADILFSPSSTDEALLDLCLQSITTTWVDETSSHEIDFDAATTMPHWQEDQALEKVNFQLDCESFDLDFSSLASEVPSDSFALDDYMLDLVMESDAIYMATEKCFES